uniref:Complex 1 LYR protein domain-containing protein n=1 Tax=Florenciella parvula TaxID=236787 RepID=A0A7S2C619_9STRA
MAQRSIALYRSILRESKGIADYNFRSYASRRARLGFEEARAVGAEDAARLYEEGQKTLGMIRRQALLGQWYNPGDQNVMEYLQLGITTADKQPKYHGVSTVEATAGVSLFKKTSGS